MNDQSQAITITSGMLSAQAKANIRHFLKEKKVSAPLEFNESEDSDGVVISALPDILGANDSIELHRTVSRLQYPTIKNA